ncbi:cation diffusion facilitator family transporter [Magnetococcus marinus MC-1]|uniref:Cation diffusion facilitator family transporter n=1 Tax=Magnetococcus marinus (strain ATCC BAA-1437 / JCM 17883 / MC-1) TaxID=156889 RepID=A0L9W4_MAGMM|nr:magnetosome biogenesis CDF transporter MamM [Magnetococcus marinus]ABK44757.1 cation diffusion facilitator family transporter [Magnetococcus marinus MC-1]
MRYSKCIVCYEMIGWAGLLVNLILSAMKIFVGIISGSHALLADALYSSKDVITSALIIVGLKVSNKPIDEKHPFGHGKIEFLLSLVVSFVLLGITGWLLFNVATVLLEGSHKAPHLIALWTAIVSVLVNLFFWGYTRCVALEINSPMVQTLAKHHHADGISSVAVAFGIIGSHYLGMPWLDSVVAVGESIHLLILGGQVFWDSVQGLMDQAGSKETQDEIKRRANEIKGVETVLEVRSRRVGQELWISVNIGVVPDMDIREAKMIADRVEEHIADTIPHVGDVNVRFLSLPGSVPEFGEVEEDLVNLAKLREGVRNADLLADDDVLTDLAKS